MNRRDFAKGLAVLPLAGCAKSLAFNSQAGQQSSHRFGHHLLVLLEGPFAVVINSKSPYNVLAFTPRHDNRHMFAFNNSVCRMDATYGFRLLQQGLDPANAPAPAYPDTTPFFAKNTPCQQSRRGHFVTLDLPGPEIIFMLPSNSTAEMESAKGANFIIPGDHLFVYTVNDWKAVTMYGSEGEDILKLDTLIKDGVSYPVFKFEVGLPNLLAGADSDPDGTHAIDFYNKGLLPHFSALADKPERRIRQIATAYGYNNNLKETLRSGPVEAYRDLISSLESILTTTTFECKIGGLTTTSP